MSKPVRILLIIALIATVSVAAMILSAHFLVSRHDNQYIRQQIEERTLAATGFELQVRGPLELPYSLGPQVILRDISINNPNQRGDQDLLHADEFQIEFAVLPLLRGEILIYGSSLDGVALNLEIDDAGEPNWISSDSSGSTSALPSQIAVNTVDSSDIEINLVNRQSGFEGSLRLSEVNLRAPRFDDQIEVNVIGNPPENSTLNQFREDDYTQVTISGYF